MLPKSKGSRTRPRRKGRAFKPQLELLEERCLLDSHSITGFGNNIANPHLGEAGGDLLRLSPAAYRPEAFGGDGVNTPSMHYAAPNFVAGPRLVSNIVSNQATVLFGPEDINTVSGNTLSDFGYTWGQFLDHDMDLTPDQTGQPVPPPPNLNRDGNNGFPIPADPNNPDDPIGSLAFSRSVFNPDTGNLGPDGISGTADDVPRQQPNVVSSFLDLSQVYGSSEVVATALRTLSSGLLKTSPGNMLPFNNLNFFTQAQLDALHMANDAHLVPDSELFAAGDVRANETIELTALHTLFVRNHNRIANLVASRFSSITDPVARDEAIYQEARKLNIAQYQEITYTGYLPALLGPNALPAYTVYKPNVNPTISTEFSTIGFRFGHSLLNNTVPRDNNDGSPISDPVGILGLAENFFNPRLLDPNGVIDPNTGHVSSDIDAILKGNADHNSQAMDVMAVSSIRNLLFGQGGPGEDLIARDIWRADDHGIGTYNQVRVAFGLPPITFDPSDPLRGLGQITSDPHVQQLLAQAFFSTAFLDAGKGAGDINPFIAGLAEDHVPGSDVGPLFHRILVDQFTRLRDGDRFFFLNQSFDAGEQAILDAGDTLAEIIRANTDITNLQGNVFVFRVSISGTVFDDLNGDGVRDPGEPGVAGERVRLTNMADRERVTVTTDANGNYSFDVFNGLGVGDWEVHLLVPDGQATTPNKVDVSITRGGIDEVVNFGFRVPGSPLLAQTPGPGSDGGAGAESLTQEVLQPLLQEALARWQAAGADASVLHRAEVHLAELGGAYLGLESGTTVWIDDNAAGWGWFVDPTPADDSEFTTPGDQGEQGRMDLLTTLMHELGHVLGRGDLYDPASRGDLMYGFLGTGERHTPTGEVTGDDVAPGLSDLGAASSAGSLDSPLVGQPDTGVSADLRVLLAAILEEIPITPETFASANQDQPALLPAQPLPSPATGEDAALTLVADDKRREAQTTLVLDLVFRDLELGLLKQDMLNDPVPALRPRQ